MNRDFSVIKVKPLFMDNFISELLSWAGASVKSSLDISLIVHEHKDKLFIIGLHPGPVNKSVYSFILDVHALYSLLALFYAHFLARVRDSYTVIDKW